MSTTTEFAQSGNLVRNSVLRECGLKSKTSRLLRRFQQMAAHVEPQSAFGHRREPEGKIRLGERDKFAIIRRTLMSNLPKLRTTVNEDGFQ